MIDLVGIVGYYSLVSVTLNTFELPVPEGEKVPFDDEVALRRSRAFPSPACGRGWQHRT